MDTVLLSQSTLASISLLNTTTVDVVNQLCRYFLQSLIVGSSAAKFDDSDEELLNAISSLFLESARCNASVEIVRTLLKEQGVNESMISPIADFYEKHSGSIITHMQVTGISMSNIVAIDWRVDYSVRSKHAGQDNTPLFFLCLKLKEPNKSEEIRSVEIIATQEELQDMLAKIKDAVKQVERLCK